MSYTKSSDENSILKGDVPNVSLPLLKASSAVLSIAMLTLECDYHQDLLVDSDNLNNYEMVPSILFQY